MKIKERALSLLLSLVMVFTFMPAMVFAADEESTDFDSAPAVEEADETTEAVEVEGDLVEAGLSKDSSEAMNGAGETYEDSSHLIYEWQSDGTLMLYWYNTSASDIYNVTSLTIPATVTLSEEGVTLTVTSIDYDALRGLDKLTSVTVPTTVTSIGHHALGYTYDSDTGDYVKVPGFTIFGKTGSAAQTYANQNGFLFRDPEAEAAEAERQAIAAAEAARQGIQVGNIPKVKISKPKAGKKNILVKWKKLTKKQLKKSKATHYEVWVCANKGFAMGETSEHIIKKSKNGVKIKKVPKGTYYVKVRAIRSVGGVKYVGPWSKVKKVKVK